MTTPFTPIATPTLDDDGVVVIDIPRLLKTKLLIAATSGAGKSWALRRVLEQAFGHATLFVYDPEGEYHTLRERFDLVLVGPGGDIPAVVATAAAVTLQLLELGVSVVFDLSELGEARDAFVAESVGALMNAPRKLWRPSIVAIDEIHKFAPERGAGTAASTAAVKSLATAGRKRPFTLLAATQRVAELHNTVLAELGNKLIGRMDLDNDIERARKALGMSTKEAHATLPRLRDGHFYVTGSALPHLEEVEVGGADELVTTPIAIKIGGVLTTHPDPSAAPLPPTPTPAHVREMIAKMASLAHLPAADFDDEPTVYPPVLARAERHDKLAADLAGALQVIEEQKVTLVELRRIADELRAARRRDSDKLLAYRGLMEGARDQFDHAVQHYGRINLDEPPYSRAEKFNDGNGSTDGIPLDRGAIPVTHDDIRAVFSANVVGPGSPSKMERALLAAIVQLTPATYDRIRRITGYKPSGPLGKAFSRLQNMQWAGGRNGEWNLTSAGHAALGTGYPIYLMGTALRTRLVSELPEMQSRILAACAEEYPGGLTVEQIRIRTGYAASGPFGKAMSELQAALYLEKTDGALRVVDDLFDDGEAGVRAVSPAELRRQIIDRLPVMEAALLTAVCAAYPDAISRDAVRKHCGYKPSGPLGKAWKALITARYIHGGSEVTASEELFA